MLHNDQLIQFIFQNENPVGALCHLQCVTLALKYVLDVVTCHFLIMRFKYCISHGQTFYIYENQHVFIVYEYEMVRYHTMEMFSFNIEVEPKYLFIYLSQTHEGPLATVHVIMVVKCSLFHIFNWDDKVNIQSLAFSVFLLYCNRQANLM